MIRSRCNRWLTYTVLITGLTLLAVQASQLYGKSWILAVITPMATAGLAGRLAGLLPGAYTGLLVYETVGVQALAGPTGILRENVMVPLILLASLYTGRRKPYAVIDAIQYTEPRFSPFLVHLTAWQALYTIGAAPAGLPEAIPTGSLSALAAGLIARNRLEAIILGVLPLHPALAAGVMAAAALRPVPPPRCSGVALKGVLLAIEGKPGSARASASRSGRALVCTEPGEPVIEGSQGLVLWYYTRRMPGEVLTGPLLVLDLAGGGYSEEGFQRALEEAARGRSATVGLGALPLEQRLALLSSLLGDERLTGLDAWIVVDARGVEVDKPSQLVPDRLSARRVAVVLDLVPGEHRLYYAPRGYSSAVAVYDVDAVVVERVVKRIAQWLDAGVLGDAGLLWPYCNGLVAVYRHHDNNVKDKKTGRR